MTDAPKFKLTPDEYEYIDKVIAQTDWVPTKNEKGEDCTECALYFIPIRHPNIFSKYGENIRAYFKMMKTTEDDGVMARATARAEIYKAKAMQDAREELHRTIQNMLHYQEPVILYSPTREPYQ